MATKLASAFRYNRSRDSDADASDYDFDLTAEEEDLLETLVASASARPSLSISSGPPTETSIASLRPDIAAVLATHASVKSLQAPEIDLNVRQVFRGPEYTDRNDETALPGFAATDASASLDGANDDRDEITAVVAEAERRMRQPVQVGNIRYPDLSRALSDTFVKPAVQAPDSDANAEKSDGQQLSPLLRFRSFPKKPFSVSDLVAGAWCELQYYHTLTRLPGGKKTRTAAMKGGSKLHQKLEDEIYTTVTIEITKKEDAFGLKLWNIIQGLRTLRDTGMTREFEVWGLVDGQVVNGVIDHLSYDNPDPDFEKEVKSSREPAKSDPKEQKITAFFQSPSKPQTNHSRQVFLTDVKTRASKNIPSGAALRPTKIQLLLYHRFLSDMAAGRLDFLRILQRYALEPDEQFSDTFVAQIGSLHDEIFDDAADDHSPTPSAPNSSPPGTSEMIRYRTLRSLITLLEAELRLTFPRGADSLGSLVNVEYRKRAGRRTSSGDAAEDDNTPDDADAGALLGTNVMFVEPHALEAYLERDMQWWKGERRPDGVPIEEAYKCRSCEFADACEWRSGQDAEILAAARKRVAGRRRAGG